MALFIFRPELKLQPLLRYTVISCNFLHPSQLQISSISPKTLYVRQQLNTREIKNPWEWNIRVWISLLSAKAFIWLLIPFFYFGLESVNKSSRTSTTKAKNSLWSLSHWLTTGLASNWRVQGFIWAIMTCTMDLYVMMSSLGSIRYAKCRDLEEKRNTYPG